MAVCLELQPSVRILYYSGVHTQQTQHTHAHYLSDASGKGPVCTLCSNTQKPSSWVNEALEFFKAPPVRNTLCFIHPLIPSFLTYSCQFCMWFLLLVATFHPALLSEIRAGFESSLGHRTTQKQHMQAAECTWSLFQLVSSHRTITVLVCPGCLAWVASGGLDVLMQTTSLSLISLLILITDVSKSKCFAWVCFTLYGINRDFINNSASVLSWTSSALIPPHFILSIKSCWHYDPEIWESTSHRANAAILAEVMTNLHLMITHSTCSSDLWSQLVFVL